MPPAADMLTTHPEYLCKCARAAPQGNAVQTQPEPPRIAPARGPPLWEDCDAQMGEGVEIEPDWDLAAQPAPDFDSDQRINW